MFIDGIKLRDEAFIPALMCGNVEVSALERQSAWRGLLIG